MAPKPAKAKATGLTVGRKVAAAAKSKGRAASGSPAPGQEEALAEGAAGGQVPAFRDQTSPVHDKCVQTLVLVGRPNPTALSGPGSSCTHCGTELC